jgi:formylmethanofuran dehydrogenase subunit B
VVCDDVAVTTKKSTLQSLGLCKLGHEYCNSIFSKTRLTQPLLKSNSGKQKPVAISSAIQKSARLLQESQKPLIFGWSNSTTEAIQLGLKLAQTTKGVFDSTASFEYGALFDARLHGGETAQVSLEDVRDSADHIVYWGVNPAESHHRHASRFTVFPKGKDIPEGRESRVVSVIDIRETESMRLANHQLILSPDSGDVEFLQALIAELKGTQDHLPETVGGVPTIEFLSFAKQLRDADNVALFYGNGLVHSTHSVQSLPLLAKLSKLLNRGNHRCWTLPMIAYCNTIGSVKTSIAATKFPFAVDFSSKGVKVVDSIQTSISNSEFDCVLIAGWDALSFLPGPLAKALSSVPLIALSTHPTLTTKKAVVVFPTALTGAETTGTVYRMDGTPVQLQPFAKAPKGILTEEDILSQLISHLASS